MADEYAKLGAELYICGRRGSVVEETAKEIAKAHNTRVTGLECDIRVAEAVEDMMTRVFNEGPIDGLVNNAAGNFISPTESLSPRAFDAIANIVFHGTFYVTQAVGKRWIGEVKSGEWKRGMPYRSVMSIVVTWVDNGSPYVVPSAMSKAGVAVMTKSLAIEWARWGIRLNAVAPGEIPTEGMSKRLSPGEEPGARSRERNPMARPGEMTELANLASFLVSRGQCDWLTGQVIAMDGGHALATGGNFYELREWSDADWQAARERIEAQNQKDKTQR
jgi:NAD(P)-dependent dehydrogenase (short-subunit alcohol dehydrogenase family)